MLRTQGRNGALRLTLYRRPGGERFFSRIFLERGEEQEEAEVESFRSYKNLYIIKFKGIDSIGEAERLTGKEIFIPESELEPPGEDEFYFHQIFDFVVKDRNGNHIGTVKEMISIPENDLLVVEREGSDILIPFNAAICPDVNLEKREIVIDPPEGLIDLDDI